MKNFYLGIIPARGGSKRVPRKNLRTLAGRPLIYYSLKAAMESSLLDYFLFSSEDKEILSVASKFADKKNIIKRPDKLASDKIRNSETMLHAAKEFMRQTGGQVTHLVLLQPTSPFRTASDIDGAIKKFEASNCDTLASVSPSVKKRDNVLKRKIDEIYCCDLIKSDVAYEFMRYNAAIYIVRYEYLISKNLFKDDFQAFYEMSELNSIDVDTELDLEISDLLMQNRVKIK